MSRIGKKVIDLPKGVTVEEKNGEIVVKGPKGQLSQSIPHGVSLRMEGDSLTFLRAADDREHRALHGLTRALTNNMVTGSIDYASNQDPHNIAITPDGTRAVAVGSFDVGVLSLASAS